MKRLAILGSLVVIADLLDITSTYLATPDLAFEWNPLVRSYGWGWEAIIMLHLVVDIIFIAWIWYHCKLTPSAEEVPSDVKTFPQTARWVVTGYHAGEREIDLKKYIGFLGLVIPLGAVINALCNTVLNLSFYFGFFGGLTESTYNIYTIIKLIIILVGICVVVYLYLKRMYGGKR
ncbi:MAG: hypothetical protein JSV49_01085 [Thermoplasmata archaeon]|nr:MAG: hypothetical protein JSV49_01085 [Thermoplasmata archaeon]